MPFFGRFWARKKSKNEYFKKKDNVTLLEPLQRTCMPIFRSIGQLAREEKRFSFENGWLVIFWSEILKIAKI